MKRDFATAVLALGAGVLTWGVSTWLEFLSPGWRIVASIGVAIVTGLIAFILLRNIPASNSQQRTKRRTASTIRGKDVTIRNVQVKSTGANGEGDTASDIDAKGNVTIEDIRDE